MRARWLVAFAAAVACTGHTDPPPVDAAPCRASVEWGQRVGGDFVSFHDGDVAPITLGFQGFRFIMTATRMTGAGGPNVDVRFQIDVDGEPTRTQEAGIFPLVAGPDGALYADSVQLFFNDVPMAQLVGRTAHVVVIVDASGCTATTHATLQLASGDCMDSDGGIHPCSDAGT